MTCYYTGYTPTIKLLISFGCVTVSVKEEIIYLYYYLRDFSYLNSFFFFLFKNTPTSLCLNRDNIKGQSSQNTTLILTKILPKK